METVSKLANKVVRGSQPLLNFNGTYSGCWQRKDMSLLLRLSVRGLVYTRFYAVCSIYFVHLRECMLKSLLLPSAP